MEATLENRVHEDLVPGNTVCLLQLEAPPQKILGLWGEPFSSNIEGLFFDVSDELQFGIGSPRGVSVQNLIEDEPQGPNIAFAGVLLAIQNLQRHVERGPHAGGHHRFRSHLLRKTEISQLQHLPLLHNVGRF